MAFRPNQKQAGGRCLIATERFNHYQALKEVKSTIKLEGRSMSKRPASSGPPQNKQQRFEWHEHMRNLICLSTKLQEVKSSGSFKRSTMDWLEHPSLFFRSPPTKLKRRCSAKPAKHGIKTTVKLPPAMSKQGLKKRLPHLTSFQPSDLKRYADALVEIVMRYNIDSPERLEQLHTIVIETIPEHYPSNFEDVVQRILHEIHRNLFQSVSK